MQLLNIYHSALANTLQYIDQTLFFFINGRLTNSFFDSLFVIWREPNTWLPVYLFLLLFVTFNFKKRSVWWILFFILTVSLCDQVSSGIVKDYFNRVRPCSDPVVSHYCRLLLGRCPSSGSFTSSHAANHFGMAVFIANTLKKYFKNWIWAFYFWAATISYAQVYVGVHYPFDIVGGGLLGSLIGYLAASFYNRRFSLEGATNPTVISKL